MRAAAAAVFLGALALAPHARAAPPAEPDDLDELYAEAHPQPRHAFASPRLGKWYGWQILLADVSFIGIFATVPAWGNVSEGGGVALALDLVCFLGAAPAIHGAHGDGDAGGIALLVDLAFTSVGALAGFGAGEATPCSGLFCHLSGDGWGAYAGTLAGASLAAIIDAAVLAWEKPEPRASSSVSWTVAPFALRGGAGLGVRASF